MSAHNVISVTSKNAAAVQTILRTFTRIDRDNPRNSLLSMNDEWLMARFGSSAALRNAALQCIMDRATANKSWTKIYDYLCNVQPVVDRSMHVFDQFIANSPNSEAVDWAKPVRARLRERLQSGWTPPFAMEVVVQRPKTAKKAVTPVTKAPVRVAKPVKKPRPIIPQTFTRGFDGLQALNAGA